MQINFSGLVNRAQNGDKGAFSELYQLTFKSSRYLALKITGDENIATQLVEESYKKAFSSIATLKNPESFEAWIKYITAVKSIELLKKKNQLVFDGQSVLPSDIIADVNEFLPKGLEKSSNAGKAINKIVDSLPARQRVVTVLHYFNEMPVSHISKILACTENDVNAELYCARNNIKLCIDRMIGRETAVYSSANKPLLTTILQTAGNQQTVDDAIIRAIFVSATKDLFAASTVPKAPEAKSVSKETVTKPESTEPGIPAKRNSKKKGLITAAIISASAVVLVGILAVVGIVGIPKLISALKKSDDISAQHIDESMLKNIEPYAENYENILSAYAEAIKDGNDVSDCHFNFVYFNDNDIPDLTISYKTTFYNSSDLYDNLLICVDGNNEDIFETVVENTWVGQKGYHIVYDTNFDNGEETEAYYIYGYENGLETFGGGLRYDKYLSDEQTYQESWVYMADANAEIQNLHSWEEYNQKKNAMLEGYYRVTSGYSIKDFVDSGKTLIKYLKKAKPEKYASFEENNEAENTLASASQSSQPESTSGVYADASSSDWKMLEKDLSKILTFCSKYNYRSDNAYEIVLPVNCTMIIYSHYFDTELKYDYGNDPLGYFDNNEYYVFNGEEVDWIISNVFNQTPDHNLKTKDRYYYNGNYYAVFYPSSCPVTEVSVVKSEKQADGSYNVTLKETSYAGESYGSEYEVGNTYKGTAKATLKQIDGKNVWSFFNIKMDESESMINEETTVKPAPEWEKNYLKELNSGDFDSFEFILTAVDDNDIPDMILIMHRGRGAITYYFMNGNAEHEYGADDSVDEVYFDKYGNMVGRYYYNGADCYDETYDFFTVRNGEIIRDSMLYHTITYSDSSKTQIAEEEYKYRRYSDDYEEVISKESFEEEEKRIQGNYTLAKATDVEDFLSSGKSLSDYYVNYRTAR